MQASSLTLQCAECGAALVRGVCPTCAFNQLLPPSRPAPEQAEIPFGRYRLTEKLASGGMGVVYRAEDRQLKRTIALKMIRGSSFAAEADRQRFTIEAEAAAALDHPNITPIYEVGVREEQPFFTMKLIPNGSLASRLKRSPNKRLPPQQTAKWLSNIARAVQHAHERGVLHRDLKPSNILFDENDKPWLTDFGLAKLVHQDQGLTLSSDRLGTPHYMAPEVVQDTQRQVSTASDVWALGIILWQCLCGRLPFQAKSPIDVMRRIAEEEPTSDIPSDVDRDLLTLAHRCLEKDPKQRLTSAAAFADELNRWLNGEPLLVRPITTTERAVKWVKRNPAWTALGLAIVCGSLVSLGLWQRAEHAVSSLSHTNERLEDTLATAQASALAAEARRYIIEDPSRALRLAVKSVGITEGQGDAVVPEAAEALYETLQRVGGQDVSPNGSRPEAQKSGFILLGAEGPEHPVSFTADGRYAAIFDTDSAPKQLTASVYDLDRLDAFGAPLHRWILPNHKGLRGAACWLENPHRLLTIDRIGAVNIWTPELRATSTLGAPTSINIGQVEGPGKLTRVWLFNDYEGDQITCQAIFEHDTGSVRRRFLISPNEKSVRLELRQSLTVPHTRGETTWHMPASQDWLVNNDSQNYWLNRLTDQRRTDAPLPLGPQRDRYCSVISQDGRWLAIRHIVRGVHLRDLRSGSLKLAEQSLHERLLYDDAVESMDFSPNSEWLAVGGRSPSVIVASTTSPSIRRLRIEGQSVHVVKFSPDGQWLGAGSREGIVTLWSMKDLREGARPLELRGLPTPVFDITFSPNGDSVIATGATSHYRYWPLASKVPGKIPEVVSHQTQEIRDLALSGDKRWLALACGADYPDHLRDKGFVKLIDLMGEHPENCLTNHSAVATGVAFSPDGKWLASTGLDGKVAVWKLSECLTIESVSKTFLFDISHTRLEYSRRVAFHPRGSLYATSGDGDLFEWDLNAPNPASTRVDHPLHSNNYLIPDVTVSPNGRWLAVARHGWDPPSKDTVQYMNMVLIYDVSQPNQIDFIAALPALFFETTSLQFSADNRWLAAGSADHGACVWDLEAANWHASRIESPVTAQLFEDVAFSPDGRWLALAGNDGRFHLWDWRSSQRPRTVFTGHAESALAWLDASRLISGGASGQAAIWETDLERLKAMARRTAE